MPVGYIRIEGPYTTAERDALTGMPTFMVIFNSTTGQFEFWNSAAWAGMLGDSPTFAGVTTSTLSAPPSSGNIALWGNFTAYGTIQVGQGGPVASANDLTLGSGNVFEITGATQINAIVTGDWLGGAQVTLIFASNPTVKHNTAGGAGTAVILLAGAADFSATAGDTLTLVYSGISGVTAWREISRAVI